MSKKTSRKPYEQIILLSWRKRSMFRHYLRYHHMKVTVIAAASYQRELVSWICVWFRECTMQFKNFIWHGIATIALGQLKLQQPDSTIPLWLPTQVFLLPRRLIYKSKTAEQQLNPHQNWHPAIAFADQNKLHYSFPSDNLRLWQVKAPSMGSNILMWLLQCRRLPE